MFKPGIISEVKPGYARVRFEEDNIVSDFLPVLVRKSKSDKESWQLEINEHVICLMEIYIDENGRVQESCDTGVILGAIYNDQDTPDPGEAAGKFRKIFSDGTEIEYDKSAGKLTVDVKGEINAKATGNVIIDTLGNLEAKAATIDCIASGAAKLQAVGITLDGNVTVNGNVTASGGVTAASIATAAGGAITGSGSMTVAGSINATGDVIGGGKSLASHTHSVPGGGNTGPAN